MHLGFDLNEALFQAVIENSFDMIGLFTEEGIFVYASPAVERCLGYKPADLVNAQSLEFIHPDDLARVTHSLHDVLGTGRGTFAAFRFRNAAGEWRWLESTGVLLPQAESPRIICVTCHDITEQKHVEEALTRSEESLLRAQRIAHLGHLEHDWVIGKSTWSDEAFRILGYEPQSIVPYFGMVVEHIPPEDKGVAQKASNELTTQGKPFNIEHRIVQPGGDVRWVQAQAEVFRDENDEIQRFTCTLLDITERKRAEASLLEHQQRLELATEAGGVGIWDWDLKTNSIVWDERMYALYGILPNDSREIYQAWAEGMHPDDRERVEADITASLQGSKEFRPKFRTLLPGGKVRHIECRAHVLRANDGTPVRFIGVNWDVTERERYEEALRTSEEKFQHIIANVPGMVYQLIRHPDGSLEWLFVSEGCRDICDREPEEIRRSDGWSVAAMDARERARFERSIAESAETLAPWHWKGRYRLPSGKTKWLEGTARVQPLPNGSTLWNGVLMDVTAHREAEEQRDQFFTLSLDMLGIGDMNGHLIRLNPAFTEVLGYSEEELKARPYLDFVHPDDHGTTRAVDGLLRNGGAVIDFENRFRTKDGSWKWLEWKAVAVLEDGLIYAAARDITQHKEAAAALRQMRDELEVRVQERTAELAQANEELLLRKTILEAQGEAALDGILIVDPQGQIVSFNRRFVEMWNIPPELLEEQSDAAALQIALGQMKAPKDFLSDVASHYSRPDERSQQEILLKDGRVFDRYSAPMQGKEGVNYGRIWFFHDVTERRQFEASLRHAHEEAEKARENAEAANRAKSEFLSRMSHELRTPLNAIMGFGQILEYQDLTPAQHDSIGFILKGGEHLLALINEVLDIARVEAGHVELDLETLDLADVVTQCCSLVRPLAEQRHIRLLDHVAGVDNRHVVADRQRFNQVLLNLLSNAIKYNRSAGEVSVSIRPVANERVQLRVQDSGFGLSAQEMEKLFTPFERLGAANSQIEGTGLGLALSQRLVTAMGGTLGVESTVGQGSTFWVELPQAHLPLEQPFSPKLAAHTQEAGQGGRTFTVLSIEDNASNIRLMEAVLERRPDVKLMAAMQGSIGLDLARQHVPDVILLDLNLPGLSGSEVLKRLKQAPETKHIPVIIISADATPRQIEQLLADGARAYLTKPMNIREFLTTLNEALQERTDG